METPIGSARAPRVHRPYCLYCYAPMERAPGAAHHCARCGALNLEVDQRLYWTREPRLRRLELALKVSIALVVGWMSYQLLNVRQVSFGTGQGWSAGAPILVGVVLWDTASKVTRRTPDFRAGLLWSVILGLVGGAVLMIGVAGLLKLRDGAPPALVAGLILFGVLMLSLAVGAARFDGALRRWQDRYVRARAGRAAGADELKASS